MKLVTAKQIQELDSIATRKYGIPSLTLMENAGRCVAEIVAKKFPPRGNILIIIGKGNNGGDGLVAARHLIESGEDVALALLSPPDTLSPDAQSNWQKLAALKPKVIPIYEDSNYEHFAEAIRNAKFLIDAIFGTGLNAPVAGRYLKIIEKINSIAKPVVSIDIPSGLSADTGEPLGAAVRSRLTITLALPKLGLVIPPAMEYIKELDIADIGFPQELIDSYETHYNLTTPDLFNEYFKGRPDISHKGDYGHVLTVAGSMGKMGAGWLSCKAALRSGAGLVTYALPSAAFEKFDSRFAEVMIEPLEDKKTGHLTLESVEDLKRLISKKDVLALGPGIGLAKETAAAVLSIVAKSNLPIVIDADALNILAVNIKALDRRINETILTPHPGEMARLTGLDTKSLLKDRLNIARNFSIQHKTYTVLKGHRTLVATPSGDIYINPTGNPGMSTAGTGDALTGAIAGLIAQKMPPKEAVLAAVYIHGLAGDLAAAKMGEKGMIASDLIENIPEAINIVKQWQLSERIL